MRNGDYFLYIITNYYIYKEQKIWHDEIARILLKYSLEGASGLSKISAEESKNTELYMQNNTEGNEMSQNTKTSQSGELKNASTKEIALISLSQVATNLFNVLFSMVTYLATGSYGIAVMLASQIAAAMRILDAVTDPIVAWFAPKVRTKFGVATPQVILGWIMEIVAILLLFVVLPSTQNVVVFTVLYVIHVLGYTLLNKAINIYKLNITNDPKKRPMFQRYNQTFVMIFTMILSVWRSNVLVPKYGGLKLGLFKELAIFIMLVGSVMMIISVLIARKYDDAEEFERNYHGATKYNLKDIWNMIAHNRAFLTEVISNATDKIASQVAGNTVVQTLLFGIIIANYKFSGSISVFTTIVTLVMIWAITGRSGRKGSKDAYLKWCWACIGVSAVTCIFMASIDPTQISKSIVPTVIFVILYSVMSSFKSTTNAACQSMTLDIQDYEFYLHGKYMGPMVNSVGSMLSKIVDSFSSILIAACIAQLGYVDTMPQPGDPSSSLLFWITMFLWLGMPALGYIASIIAMHWYPLDAKTMEEVQKHNQELRAANIAKFEAEKAAKK